MNDLVIIILTLALGTFMIRAGGYFFASRIPSKGLIARMLQALPGCLISSLLTVLLLVADPIEWWAACAAMLTAFWTKNLLLTMFIGVMIVWVLRSNILL